MEAKQLREENAASSWPWRRPVWESGTKTCTPSSPRGGEARGGDVQLRGEGADLQQALARRRNSCSVPKRNGQHPGSN